MNKGKKNSSIEKNLKNLSKALFVLSQIANQRKNEILRLKEVISSYTASDEELNALKLKLKQLTKKQQFFHAERTEIFRFLIYSKLVNLKGFNVLGAFNYGVVQMGDHHFYVIINKKLIEKFQLNKIGEGLKEFESLSEEELNIILPLREAEKIFKQSLAKIRSTIKKANKVKSKKSTKAQSDQILSKSLSSNGSIVVIKKRKFSGAVPTNKN